MRALEFQSTIENNHIIIPKNFLSEFEPNSQKDIRVIVLLDDSDVYDSLSFKKATQDSFFKGYSDSDSIYDNE